LAKSTVDVISEAIAAAPQRKFPESVELAINLKDVDLSIPKNRINEEIILPKGRGKNVKVGLFGSGEMVVKAKGKADFILKVEELEEFAGDKKQAKKVANEMSFFVAEAPLMPVIGKRLGQVLATRGKMPKPIPPGADPSPFIENLRRSVTVRSKANRTFHALVGSKDMNPADIAENVQAVLKRVTSKLERGQQNIASAYVKTTMGPSVKLL